MNKESGDGELETRDIDVSDQRRAAGKEKQSKNARSRARVSVADRSVRCEDKPESI